MQVETSRREVPRGTINYAKFQYSGSFIPPQNQPGRLIVFVLKSQPVDQWVS